MRILGIEVDQINELTNDKAFDMGREAVKKVPHDEFFTLFSEIATFPSEKSTTKTDYFFGGVKSGAALRWPGLKR